jgi:DNA-binding beta-propeller fold protein YncE
MTGNSRFEIDASGGDSVQSLAPPNELDRCEGIAFSSSGDIIAVAGSDTNKVFFYRRQPGGPFEDTPYWSISGPASRLNYPHDVAFSPSGDEELLAVAARGGAIVLFAKNRTDDTYGPDPVFEICGKRTKLDFSDGVAFVPPNNDYLAACNLIVGNVSLFRQISHSQVSFKLDPVFDLSHHSLSHPDGLAFSQCGTWLAVANHRNHSVSVFQRRNRALSMGRLKYGPRPVTILKDPAMRHPHSVAFTPENHLVVTNAGANYFSVYEPRRHFLGMRWSQSPVSQTVVGSDRGFREINARNKMEGGPKGVAIHKNSLAVCSPELGIKIYSFRERALAR